MVETGFLETGRASPTGATFVVAVHGAAIAALLLAKAPLVVVPEYISTRLYPVVPQMPPPRPIESKAEKLPPKPDPRPKARNPIGGDIVLGEGPVAAQSWETEPRQETLPPSPPPPLPIDRGARAKGDLRALIGADDYPDAALRDHVEGRVQVRLEVGSNGRATSCTVVESSGSAQLDSTTCRLLKARARFNPARDSGGGFIPDSYLAPRIVWRLID